MTVSTSFTTHNFPGLYRTLGWQPLPAAPSTVACVYCHDRGTVWQIIEAAPPYLAACTHCNVGWRMVGCRDCDTWHDRAYWPAEQRGAWLRTLPLPPLRYTPAARDARGRVVLPPMHEPSRLVENVAAGAPLMRAVAGH